AILRFFFMKTPAVLVDPFSREVVGRCRKNAIPVTLNQYIDPAYNPTSGADGSGVLPLLKMVKKDGRFTGFILYESATYLRFDAHGGCTNTWPILKTLGPLLAA